MLPGLFQMMLWVVSGARRRVGKTWLSLGLTRVLPNAVYAKIGHNPPRAGKPENYFTNVEDFLAFQKRLPATCQHCVVESNAVAIRNRAGVRIFIGAHAGMADLRENSATLEAEADIRICRHADPVGWRQVLVSKLQNADHVTAVSALLERQQQFIASAPPTGNDRLFAK